MAPIYKYADGEKLLCYHGPLIYEAKCLKSSVTKDKHVRYLVHYAGWNKNWDEWVPESRILKYNEGNLQRQKEVQRLHTEGTNQTKKTPAKGRKSEAPASATPARKKSKASSTSAGKAATPVRAKSTRAKSKDTSGHSGTVQPKKKRGRRVLSVESEPQESFPLVDVRINIPEELKEWLVDDWDVIIRQQKLAMLPAKLTVSQIIDNYLAFQISSKSDAQVTEIRNFTKGIKEYFNAALGSQLLYKFERPQYSDLLRKYPGTVSDKYGGIHLLRSIAKMGPMLTKTALDEEPLQELLSNVQEFLKYMVANRATLFNLQDYQNATPAYHRRLQ